MAIAKISSRGPIYVLTDSNVALTAGNAKALMMLKAGGTGNVRIVYWQVSFDGTSASAEPVDVQLARFTSDGTTPTTPTVVKMDSTSGGHTVTPSKGHATQPSVGDIFWEGMVHPQGGRVEVRYDDPATAPVIRTGDTNNRVGIRATAAAAVNCSLTLVWEEI